MINLISDCNEFLLTHNFDTNFPLEGYLVVKAPQRVAFFVWTAAWGRILTCDNLRRQGIVTAGWYCMCMCSGEMVEHPLLHCRVAREIWSYVFWLFGVDWIISGCVLELSILWVTH